MEVIAYNLIYETYFWFSEKQSKIMVDPWFYYSVIEVKTSGEDVFWGALRTKG